MQVSSPISNLRNTKLKKTIQSVDIINLYKNDFDIDVSGLFSNLKQVLVFECLDTGYLFYYPTNLSGNESFYDALKIQMPVKYNVPYYSDIKWEHNICAEYINRTDKVYEIGAGTGAFLAKLKSRGIEQLFGSELNEGSIQTALEKGIVLENRTIEDKSLETVNEYDVVCAFQVLEHVENVHSFIAASLTILKPGGKLIFAVPNNNPFLFRNDIFNTLNLPPHHMGLWSKKAFENLPKFFPLEIERIFIEQLHATGYDFERYYEVNKDFIYSKKLPFKSLFDRVYRKWLKRNYLRCDGKNIIAIYTKN